MPAPGTTKLSDKKKARILAKKWITTDNARSIAAQEKVAIISVHKIRENTVSDKVLKMAEREAKTLSERLADVRDLSLSEMKRSLERGDSPLNQVAQVFQVVNNAKQLEDGRPTSITQHQWTPERHALEFFKVLLAKEGSFDKALAAFRQASLAPLVSDHTRDTVAVQVESNPKLLDGMTD
jgi:hypothetical protein